MPLLFKGMKNKSNSNLLMSRDNDSLFNLCHVIMTVINSRKSFRKKKHFILFNVFIIQAEKTIQKWK